MRAHRSSQFLCEDFFRHEINPVFHDMVCCPCQFVRQRGVCDHEVGLSQFTVIKSSGLIIIASGKFCRFGECPGKVLVAVFLVSLPLGFAVADPLCGDCPAISSFGDVVKLVNHNDK